MTRDDLLKLGEHPLDIPRVLARMAADDDLPPPDVARGNPVSQLDEE